MPTRWWSAPAGAGQATPNATDTAQQFQILYNIDSDTFRLRHRSTWLCLAAQNAGNAPGTAVVEEPVYCAMPHELWRLQNLGGGYYRVVNVWNGLALQTDGQTPATVALAVPSADTRQQWQINFQTNYPKKGVAGNEANWAMFGASWDYNWSRNPSMPAPAQVVFLPQQWNGAAMNTLPQWFPGWHTNPKPMALLGFNEPDHRRPGQYDHYQLHLPLAPTPGRQRAAGRSGDLLAPGLHGQQFLEPGQQRRPSHRRKRLPLVFLSLRRYPHRQYAKRL